MNVTIKIIDRKWEALTNIQVKYSISKDNVNFIDAHTVLYVPLEVSTKIKTDYELNNFLEKEIKEKLNLK